MNRCGWLPYATGGCWRGPAPSTVYNELSGFLSIVLPLAVQLTVFGFVYCWHHQCGVYRCYWPARRLTAAGDRACWKHHPAPRRTAGDVRRAHHAAVAAHRDTT